MLKTAERPAESRKETARRDGRDGLKAALAPPKLIAAVDLGAAKVACFIMKPDGVRKGDRTLTTCGVGYVQSRGIKGGSIVNLDEASEAIAQAVERAENVAGVSVQGVTVATAGGQLSSSRVAGRVSLGARPIGDADLIRAIQSALAQIKLPGRRAVHILPVAWSVDGQGGVRDPRAMFGRALGVELLVVSVAETVFNTLGACVERAHLQLDGVVAAPFVSALAALEEDEMDLGAVCIDMGGARPRPPCSGGAAWCTWRPRRSAASMSPRTSPAACPPRSPGPSASRPCMVRPSPRRTRTAR